LVFVHTVDHRMYRNYSLCNGNYSYRTEVRFFFLEITVPYRWDGFEIWKLPYRTVGSVWNSEITVPYRWYGNISDFYRCASNSYGTNGWSTVQTVFYGMNEYLRILTVNFKYLPLVFVVGSVIKNIVIPLKNYC